MLKQYDTARRPYIQPLMLFIDTHIIHFFALSSAVLTGQQQDYSAPAGEYWPDYDGYGNSGGAASPSQGRGDNAGASAGQYGAGAGAAGGYGASQAGGYSAQPPQGPPQPVSHNREQHM